MDAKQKQSTQLKGQNVRFVVCRDSPSRPVYTINSWPSITPRHKFRASAAISRYTTSDRGARSLASIYPVVHPRHPRLLHVILRRHHLPVRPSGRVPLQHDVAAVVCLVEQGLGQHQVQDSVQSLAVRDEQQRLGEVPIGELLRGHCSLVSINRHCT